MSRTVTMANWRIHDPKSAHHGEVVLVINTYFTTHTRATVRTAETGETLDVDAATVRVAVRSREVPPTIARRRDPARPTTTTPKRAASSQPRTSPRGTAHQRLDPRPPATPAALTQRTTARPPLPRDVVGDGKPTVEYFKRVLRHRVEHKKGTTHVTT